MRTSPSRRRHSGYVSFLLVISTGAILTILTIYAYRRAMNSHSIQSQVQLRVDYSEKEEAILRSIVAVTPNRSIRAMKSLSNVAGTREPLSWQNIFTESLALANARTSISTDLINSLNIANLKTGNSGDSALAAPGRIFTPIVADPGYFVSAGINRSLGAGYPSPLTADDATTAANDRVYPVISDYKYDPLAPASRGPQFGGRSKFNLLRYPQINFGYAKPGENFVAKRNWWAFSLDVADHDDDRTLLARSKRNFVLSIYEIPSQLSISASSFMSLGQYASGEAWEKVNIDGGIFAGKAEVTGTTDLNTLSSRRGVTLSNTTTFGNQSLTDNQADTATPFKPGVRESYQNKKDEANPVKLANQSTTGAFFPVSLASESGRVAFYPISRGQEFFDRFLHPATEPNALSTTTWNNYTIGALQCAMRIDITKVVSATDPTPTEFKFSCLNASGVRNTVDTTVTPANYPPGYYPFWVEGNSYNFGTEVVDVAYGKNGSYAYKTNVTGTVTFNNATFGDPLVGTEKIGYLKMPFERAVIPTVPVAKSCVAFYPKRVKAFLRALGAGDTSINNSVVVNVNHTGLGATIPKKPGTPCTDADYGLIMKECADLTMFTKGFSLVSNLRLYIGDDFNIVAATPPAGYTPAVTASNPTGRFLPPCSLFVPEKRYGVDVDAYKVNLSGQVGSLATDTVANAVRPLDSKNLSGNAITADRITVNLSQIRHPAEIPPITMMNWLVMIEELRR
ncbi:MAG: hypothetical protein V4584_05155 [Verrucomicrobiota bacterium]